VEINHICIVCYSLFTVDITLYYILLIKWQLQFPTPLLHFERNYNILQITTNVLQHTADYSWCTTTYCRLQLMYYNILQITTNVLQHTADYSWCTIRYCRLQLMYYQILQIIADVLQHTADYSWCTIRYCRLCTTHKELANVFGIKCDSVWYYECMGRGSQR